MHANYDIASLPSNLSLSNFQLSFFFFSNQKNGGTIYYASVNGKSLSCIPPGEDLTRIRI